MTARAQRAGGSCYVRRADALRHEEADNQWIPPDNSASFGVEPGHTSSTSVSLHCRSESFSDSAAKPDSEPL